MDGVGAAATAVAPTRARRSDAGRVPGQLLLLWRLRRDRRFRRRRRASATRPPSALGEAAAVTLIVSRVLPAGASVTAAVPVPSGVAVLDSNLDGVTAKMRITRRARRPRHRPSLRTASTPRR